MCLLSQDLSQVARLRHGQQLPAAAVPLDAHRGAHVWQGWTPVRAVSSRRSGVCMHGGEGREYTAGGEERGRAACVVRAGYSA